MILSQIGLKHKWMGGLFNLKFGLIVPSSNTIIETEFRKVLPDSFMLHSSRVSCKVATLSILQKMEKDTINEAIKLADAEVDIIIYGCTAGSLFRGPSHYLEIEKNIEGTTGIPTITTAGAVVDALRFLDIHKVCVATPYIDEVNKAEIEFLTKSGFEVIELKSLYVPDGVAMSRLNPEEIFNHVKSLRYDLSDGIFISCTNLPTISNIAQLEDELKMPIISSNTSTIWKALRKMGSTLRITGYGKLLEA